MNIVEWCINVDNDINDPKQDNLRKKVQVIPGVLNSKFLKKEGTMTITMDTDLCTKDEIMDAISTKFNTYLQQANQGIGINMNYLMKKLFRR